MNTAGLSGKPETSALANGPVRIYSYTVDLEQIQTDFSQIPICLYRYLTIVFLDFSY